MSERKCWTCGNEHGLDEACQQSSEARTAKAAGGRSPFGTVSETDGAGSIFSARFYSKCDTCGGTIRKGDQIRIVDGAIECENCIEDAHREGHP